MIQTGVGFIHSFTAFPAQISGKDSINSNNKINRRRLRFSLRPLPSKKINEKYLLVLTTIFMSFTIFNIEPVDRPGVKGPLT